MIETQWDKFTRFWLILLLQPAIQSPILSYLSLHVSISTIRDIELKFSKFLTEPQSVFLRNERFWFYLLPVSPKSLSFKFRTVTNKKTDPIINTLGLNKRKSCKSPFKRKFTRIYNDVCHKCTKFYCHKHHKQDYDLNYYKIDFL